VDTKLNEELGKKRGRRRKKGGGGETRPRGKKSPEWGSERMKKSHNKDDTETRGIKTLGEEGHFMGKKILTFGGEKSRVAKTKRVGGLRKARACAKAFEKASQEMGSLRNPTANFTEPPKG